MRFFIKSARRGFVAKIALSLIIGSMVFMKPIGTAVVGKSGSSVSQRSGIGTAGDLICTTTCEDRNGNGVYDSGECTTKCMSSAEAIRTLCGSTPENLEATEKSESTGGVTFTASAVQQKPKDGYKVPKEPKGPTGG